MEEDSSENVKENKVENTSSSKKRSRSTDDTLPDVKAEEEPIVDARAGATGPNDEFLAFPEYDGTEPPKEPKKAFTKFCVAKRKEVKASLDPADRKNKDKVNGILRDKWLASSDDDKQIWRKWAAWDKKRYARDLGIYEEAQKTSNGNSTKANTSDNPMEEATAQEVNVPKKVPKKRKIS